jgi:putative effector of murein hydrolase LrgA (UPF0299 family)
MKKSTLYKLTMAIYFLIGFATFGTAIISIFNRNYLFAIANIVILFLAFNCAILEKEYERMSTFIETHDHFLNEISGKP